MILTLTYSSDLTYITYNDVRYINKLYANLKVFFFFDSCKSIKYSVTSESSRSLHVYYKVLLTPEVISPPLILANFKNKKCSVTSELSLPYLFYFDAINNIKS